MGPLLRNLLLIVAAIILLFLAIKVVGQLFAIVFYILAILAIGYVVMYLLRGSKP